jgi:hypothetical protein
MMHFIQLLKVFLSDLDLGNNEPEIIIQFFAQERARFHETKLKLKLKIRKIRLQGLRI